MISTVTTTTTTTTTVTTVASATMSAGLGLMSTLTLIVLLIAKELTGAQVQYTNQSGELGLSGAFDRVSNIAIVPLLIVFSSIVIVKILEVLR